jgi:hypothetical protein
MKRNRARDTFYSVPLEWAPGRVVPHTYATLAAARKYAKRRARSGEKDVAIFKHVPGAEPVRINPPASVAVTTRAFGSRRGHLVGRDVLAVEYKHAQSARGTPYRHDFESAGVELWALADGSLLIRHPKHRLWDDFTVEDGE